MMVNKYTEYFNIDKDFFRCIDQEAIHKTPELWKKTFPHPTFIKLIKKVEKMLRGSNEPIWIHGSYGTGKSQCAYALKKILDVSESELKEYWDKFEVLNTNANLDLLAKLQGHKERKIVTAFRYASGGINSTRDLLIAVQDSVKKALIDVGIEYSGENTLRDSVIAWVEEPTRKDFFNSLLQKPEYASRFSQSTANEVLDDLHKGGELKELMENIFYLADKEGITALNLDTDRLIKWLKDIIEKNQIKIVLIWDEFSSFFTNNRSSLDEFQKLVSLAQSTAFYFLVVTHLAEHVISNPQDQAWKTVRQRYDFTEITLPDSIAFDLIGSALDVLPTAKADWDVISDNLYSEVPESTHAVIEQVKKNEPLSAININVFRKIMPLHPYAAMVLKYIANAFEANQRSMFDFIKSAENEDVEAFQWFIANTAQDDDRPLLTIDLLWDFFYEKGRDNLTADIQLILDTFSHHQNLDEKQKAVLKTILIVQAIDQRTNNQHELFRLTDKNLSLTFEGVSELDGNAAVSIAKHLVNEKILMKRDIGNNQEVYCVIAHSSIITRKPGILKDLRENLTAEKLVTDGGLASILLGSQSLKLRFDMKPPFGELITATHANFSKVLDSIKSRNFGWRFIAVLCFEKDDKGVEQFRKAIMEATVSDNFEDVIFIDALSTPLGEDAFEKYIDYESDSMIFSGNDKELAKKYAEYAKDVLENDWKDRIKKGGFIVYSSVYRNGERFQNVGSVDSFLESIVKIRYPLIMDFNKGLTDTMLKLTQGVASAKHGALQTSGGAIRDIEKFTLNNLPHPVWKVDRYWEQNHLIHLPISKIKIALESIINEAFNDGSGQIAIRELYDMLENDFGFSVCNLSAFLTGFLLKEYCTDAYRFIDSTGKPLDALDREETLAKMIGDCIDGNNRLKYKDTYIATMTADERAFYELTETAFDISPDSFATVGVAAIAIGKKMSVHGLPVWAVSLADGCEAYDVIEKYIALVQKEGSDALSIAKEIGKIAQIKSTLGDRIKTLMSDGNLQKGLREFLKTFENGKILDLASEIGAEATLIDDVRRLFSVERSHLWIRATGEEVIRRLLVEYGITNETNAILSENATSLKKALAVWRDRLRFIRISAEVIKVKQPDLTKLIDFLFKIYMQTELMPEQMKAFYSELQEKEDKLSSFLSNERELFTNVYTAYLDGFTANDIEEIIARLTKGMFALSSSECNIKVKDEAEKYRKSQLKVKLLSLWKEKTGSLNPRKWSEYHSTPILAMVVGDDYDNAKKAFDTLDQSNPPDFAIKDALSFLEKATFFNDLQSAEKRDAAFSKSIVGDYIKLLTVNQVREKLELLAIDVYDWFLHPHVKNLIQELVEAEYHAGGSDTALSILREMTDEERETYVERLVKDNVTVGVEIISRGGKL